MTISCIRYKGKDFPQPYLVRSFRIKGKTKQKSFYLGKYFRGTDKQISNFYSKHPETKDLNIDWIKVKEKIVPKVVLSLSPKIFDESKELSDEPKTRRIQEISKELGKSVLGMGRILTEVKEKKLYLAKYNSFEEFLIKDADTSLKSAESIMEIWRQIKNLKPDVINEG